MDLIRAIDYFRNNHELAANVKCWKTFPAVPGNYLAFPSDIDSRLVEILKKRGISHLYSHQKEAFDLARRGLDFVVVTPTASGKSLCYNLPVLNALLKEDPEARALYLFPTKALSSDQVDELYGMVEAIGADIKTYTFDGDTPASARSAIRKAGHIVVTNPDMLHSGILPHHTLWIKLFEKLRFLIIDEIHHYRGVFGSHLANVLRRLWRLCEFYGSKPQVICCSATIGNPSELAEAITGRQMQVIDKSGAPVGERHFVLYNPPMVNAQLGIRRSVIKEAAKLAAFFIAGGVQTIVFARSRVNVEVLAGYIKEELIKKKKSPDLVKAYRGGYLPNERRTIEKGLRERSILGVVSTNALELGIDIGGLDVSIMAGYPGAVSSLWQQAGRAGRKNAASLSILIASSSPMDQFLVNNSNYFFAKNPESGLIDADNPMLAVSHLKCAAFELPLHLSESYGNLPLKKILDYLAGERVLHQSGEKYHYSAESYPATDVSLRSASPENFVIMDQTDGGKVIGELDEFSAPELLHPEAIYLHQTAQYQVKELDWDGKRAYVVPVEVDYYTDAESKVSLKVLHKDEEHQDKVIRGWGDVAISRVVVNYKKIKFFTHENCGWGRVSLPEQNMHTTSFWLSLSDEFVGGLNLSPEQLGGGLRGCAHLLRKLVSLWIMCDPADLRAAAMVRSPFQDLPTIYLYDNYPGGIGFSRRIYLIFDEISAAAAEHLRACPCDGGCPSCVGPMLEVGEKGKFAAQVLLDSIARA